MRARKKADEMKLKPIWARERERSAAVLAKRKAALRWS